MAARATTAGFPIEPPIEPMLAKLATELPEGDGWLFEPKWDGFRAIVFRDRDRFYIQRRPAAARPLFPGARRVSPQLAGALRRRQRIVIATDDGLDFDALQLRLHPAASRVNKLAAETPASFVAFDALAADGEDLRSRPQAERRQQLEQMITESPGGVHLTPCSRDRSVAQEWFHRFEGAGLDGVIAKHENTTYQPGKRAMIKVKHVRTADCVVAGFRWHKQGPGTLVGSLLLGLYDEAGALHHVGVTSSFPMTARRRPRNWHRGARTRSAHPWDWANLGDGDVDARRSQPWECRRISPEPLRTERVCEVKYDHLRDRFGTRRSSALAV
jgi:ATP-dependent DNA ligase